VPVNDIAQVAADMGGTSYDIKGVELGHVGDRCSFDAIIRAYGIEIPPSFILQAAPTRPAPT
jgi:hypothetical protein